MIPRYTDHSANERTYLAWIRTAIAIIAFGFLIEKFDLFLLYLSQALRADPTVHLHPSRWAEWVGLGLIGLGVLVILVATRRFYQYRRMIATDAAYPYGATFSCLLLAMLMVVVALFLLGYLGHTLFSVR